MYRLFLRVKKYLILWFLIFAVLVVISLFKHWDVVVSAVGSSIESVMVGAIMLAGIAMAIRSVFRSI